MNHKLKGRTLFHGDIARPELAIAEFTPELTQRAIENIVNCLNHGHEMLHAYRQYRNDLHISNIMPLLEELEKIYRAWDKAEYASSRKPQVALLVTTVGEAYAPPPEYVYRWVTTGVVIRYPAKRCSILVPRATPSG